MTILYPSPIFGPVRSRRLGISLGINLMPADGKVCTFDCIYCECGLNAERRPKSKIPTREAVAEALEVRLRQMVADDEIPDVLTFAGNGEPTSHPDFAAIISDTITLRNRYCPKAKVTVLSNGTNLHRKDVVQALLSVDNNIQKLDTVSREYTHLLDRPVRADYDPMVVAEQMIQFKGHVIVQTMFLTGTDKQGHDVDNTGSDFIDPWIETVKRISPSQVMIYTIDRETPVQSLCKAPVGVLDAIAERLRNEGLAVSVSY